MEDLKISYIDWWDNGQDFLFSKLLEQKYNLIFDSPENCDVVFTGPFGDRKKSINNFKIHYTGENSRNPDDGSFCMNYNINSDVQLPIYYVMSSESTFISKRPSPLLLESRVNTPLYTKKFCGFLVSNPVNGIRNQAFIDLSKYKHVDSGGSVLNNIGYKVPNTIDWMSQYKFFICFENSKYDYYITEKLINAYHSGCIPIYWGSDTVADELNEKCMINVNKMKSFDEMVAKIKEIDENDDLYHQMINEPLLKDNKFNESFNSENILEIMVNAIKNRKK